VRRKRGRFECAVCGAVLPMMPGRRTRTVLVRAPGPRTDRLIVVDGREVHRCTLHHPAGSQHP
jgi:hypothetical protein